MSLTFYRFVFSITAMICTAAIGVGIFLVPGDITAVKVGLIMAVLGVFANAVRTTGAWIFDGVADKPDPTDTSVSSTTTTSTTSKETP